MGQPRGPSGAFIRYARYLADLQAMPQGGVCSLETKRHPRPARLLSARFGKALGHVLLWRGVSALEAQRARQQPALRTAVFLHFRDLGLDMRGLSQPLPTD